VNLKSLFLASFILTLAIPNAYAAVEDIDWQRFGSSDEGGQLYLDMSSPQRTGDRNIVDFVYRNIRPDGTEWTRSAKADECFAGRTWKLNGRPSGWTALVDSRWIKIKTDSDAAKNLLINVCRIAGGQRSIEANNQDNLLSKVEREVKDARIAAQRINSLIGEYDKIRESKWAFVSQEDMPDGTTKRSYIQTSKITRKNDLIGFTIRVVYSQEQTINSSDGIKSYIETNDVFVIDCIGAVAIAGDILYIGVDGLPVAQYKATAADAERIIIAEDKVLAKLRSSICPQERTLD
jgi:hypothetical protein